MTVKTPDASWLGNPNTTPMETLTIADILASQVDSTTGSISYTLGNAITGEVCTTNAMAFNAAGMTSIPVGPGAVATNGNVTPGNTSAVGAQAVCYVRNDQWIVMNIRDTRTQSRAGNPSPGDSVLVSQNGQARVCAKSNGTISLYTTKDNIGSGAGMSLMISPTAGVTGGPGFIVQADCGTLRMDDSGWHITTSTGASIDIGGMSAAGPLASALGTYVNVNAAMINLNSSFVTCGPSVITGATPQPVMLATNFQVAMTTLLTALVATFTAAGTCMTGPSTNPANLTAALVTFGAAITAFEAQLSTTVASSSLAATTALPI